MDQRQEVPSRFSGGLGWNNMRNMNTIYKPLFISYGRKVWRIEVQIRFITWVLDLSQNPNSKYYQHFFPKEPSIKSDSVQ